MSGRGRGRGGGRGGGQGQSLPFRPGFRDYETGGGGRGGRGGGGGGGYDNRGRGGGGGRGYDNHGRGGRGGGGGGRGAPPPPVDVYSQGTPVIDQSVLSLEDKVVAQTKKGIIAKPKNIPPVHPARPGYGTKGANIVLWANYFRLDCNEKLSLHRYSIEIKGVADGNTPKGKLLKRLITLLVTEALAEHGGKIASDYKANLICADDLGFQEHDFKLTYRPEGADEPEPGAKEYEAHVQFTGHLSVHELMNYLTSSQMADALTTKEEIITALNIILSNHPKLDANTASVANNRHFAINATAQNRADLPHGLEAIRGYFVSVRAATSRLLLNVQIKNMAFYRSITVSELIGEFFGGGAKSIARLQKFLHKLNVDAMHINKTNKAGQRIPSIRTIWKLATTDDGHGSPNPPRVSQWGAGSDGVEFFLSADGPTSPQAKKGSKSSSQSGRYISVSDFFKQTYGITIGNTKMPVLNVGSRERPVYLPAQVCCVLPGQPAKALLNPDQTKKMMDFAVKSRRPHLNAGSIVTDGNALLGLEPSNKTLNAFRIKVTPKLVAVPGRVLSSPGVKYSQGGAMKVTNGSWNLIKNKFVRGSRLDRWTPIYIRWQGGQSPWSNPNELQETLRRFRTKLVEIGITAADALPVVTLFVNQGSMESDIERMIKQTVTATGRPQLVYVLLPENDNVAMYKHVKYVCDVLYGVHNVCVIDNKLHRGDEQFYANEGLKINLKLGGTNHSLDPSQMGILKENKTMVVGMDVTHPSPGSAKTAPSVAAVVASVDGTLSQWPAALRIQEARQEMLQELDELILSRLRLWRVKNNQALPENILVYRDGVSEGQYNLVLEQELPAFRRACEKIYPATDTKKGLPKISIVIVGKRHHTRFYPTNKDTTNPKSGNPMSGTVVDRGITQAWLWDFFLQAHHAIQGTARPAHYYVIYDQIFREKYASGLSSGGLTPQDALEQLTHNMCYLFPRATKAVSICPAAYHADLACERGRDYLRSYFEPSSPSGTVVDEAGTTASLPSADRVKVHENLKNSMFYV